MSTIASFILLGFVFGMRHATDADHVIAVATIVGRERQVGPAAMIGALWGVGHTTTLALVGGAMIVLGVVIPERVAQWMELAVGVMLVVLGIAALWGLRRLWGRRHYAPLAADTRHVHARGGTVGRPHAHTHAHGDYAHTHRHGHSHADHGHEENATPAAWLDRRFGRLGAYQALRPVCIGVVHGLAGSAAVALMVLGAIRDPWWGVAYLLVFGAGTIVGMMLITAVIAIPFSLSSAKLPRVNTGLRVASGVLSIAFGAWLLYRIGIAQGLFASLA